MYLYLLRHGLAERPRAGIRDRERRLTDQGTARMRLQARALARLNRRLDVLWTSPFERARATADLVAPAFGAEPTGDSLLTPGCRFADVIELLNRHPEADHVMLVGHQPDLATHVYRFTGNRVSIHEGTLAVLEVQRPRAGRGRLEGLYDPDLLVALGSDDS